MDEDHDDGEWIALDDPIRFPSKIVGFHKVMEGDEVVDILAMLEDGRTVSQSGIFGDATEQ